MATLYLRPSAAGDETNITYQYPAPGEHWDKVDEVTPDEDATYVAVVNQPSYLRDLYNLDDTAQTGTINWIKVWFRGYQSADELAYGKTEIKTGGIVYSGSDILLSPYIFTNYSTQYTTNPQTGGAWTWTQLNALQAGVSLQATGLWLQAWCTQVYIEVNYFTLTQKTISEAMALDASLGVRRVFKSIIDIPILYDTSSQKYTGAGTAIYNKILSETISVASNIQVSASQIYIETMGEVLSVADSITKVIYIKRTVTDVISLIGSVTFWSTTAQLVSDVIATGEEVVKTISKTVSDSLTVADSKIRSVWKSISNTISLVSSIGVSVVYYVPVVTKLYLAETIYLVANAILPTLNKLTLTEIISLAATAVYSAFVRAEIDMRLSTEPYLDMTLSIEGGGD